MYAHDRDERKRRGEEGRGQSEGERQREERRKAGDLGLMKQRRATPGLGGLSIENAASSARRLPSALF